MIVSSADYQAQRRDLVIMAITSQIRPRPAFAEFTVAAWKKAGLIAPSAVKPVLTTIEKRLVLKSSASSSRRTSDPCARASTKSSADFRVEAVSLNARSLDRSDNYSRHKATTLLNDQRRFAVVSVAW